MTLSAAEARVLGCLLEKQRTTPDMYPLTLNALRLACNQSTNRHPVVDYDETTVRDALHRLERRGFTRLASGRGSRAPKYRHLLAEALPMDDGERALICVLMLRGPQTPGELKQRGERMHRFATIEEVHETLRGLIGRGLIERLERRPGQKEERYAQLLGAAPGADTATADGFDASSAAAAADGHWEPRPPAVAAPQDAPVAEPPEWVASLYERLAKLEREVAELRALGSGPNEAVTGQPEPAVRE